MHYCGLLYARHHGESDPTRAAEFRHRAALFAPQFAAWFAADGSAIPYGRSLAYRFAQCAFWGALAYSGVAALPWGQSKRLYLRNLRWWARQPIFTEAGLLSIGYRYPNLIMAEAYNAPGSPYFACASFFCRWRCPKRMTSGRANEEGFERAGNQRAAQSRDGCLPR